MQRSPYHVKPAGRKYVRRFFPAPEIGLDHEGQPTPEHSRLGLLLDPNEGHPIAACTWVIPHREHLAKFFPPGTTINTRQHAGVTVYFSDQFYQESSPWRGLVLNHWGPLSGPVIVLGHQNTPITPIYRDRILASFRALDLGGYSDENFR